jgi:hypothetical protein
LIKFSGGDLGLETISFERSGKLEEARLPVTYAAYTLLFIGANIGKMIFWILRDFSGFFLKN